MCLYGVTWSKYEWYVSLQDKALVLAMAPLLGGYVFQDASLLREVRAYAL
jgi:hypothetical protein